MNVVKSASDAAAWVLAVILALANVTFAFVSSWIPVLLVVDCLGTTWVICHSLGSSDLCFSS